MATFSRNRTGTRINRPTGKKSPPIFDLFEFLSTGGREPPARVPLFIPLFFPPIVPPLAPANVAKLFYISPSLFLDFPN